MKWINEVELSGVLGQVNDVQTKLSNLWNLTKEAGLTPDKESILNLFFGRETPQQVATKKEKLKYEALPEELRQQQLKLLGQKYGWLGNHRDLHNTYYKFGLLSYDNWEVNKGQFKLNNAKKIFTQKYTFELTPGQIKIVNQLEQLIKIHKEVQTSLAQIKYKPIAIQDLKELFYGRDILVFKGQIDYERILRIEV